MGAVRVFGPNIALDDANGSHACLLEASMHVHNVIHLGWFLFNRSALCKCVSKH
jgi:hypothetical protein